VRNQVTIVISYQTGTGGILATCLASLARHTMDVPHEIVVLTRKGGIDNDLLQLKATYVIDVVEMPNIDHSVSSRVHGMMLDGFIPAYINTEYLMTLDSDCFPIADGWLSDLLAMMKNDARIVGILHPWAPPPAGMSRQKIEWRIRSQHCWETTHVACQMLKKLDFNILNKPYNLGDDTGLAILIEAKKQGWKIDGFKPTRCPIPEGSTIDPEFNRYVGIVFGDKVYHHGGFTRTTTFGDKPVFGSEFAWVGPRVLKDKGAEFLLDDEFSYRFKFDREEEIAKEKMQRLFGLDSQKLK